jgi:hypothetical protein
MPTAYLRIGIADPAEAVGAHIDLVMTVLVRLLDDGHRARGGAREPLRNAPKKQAGQACEPSLADDNQVRFVSACGLNEGLGDVTATDSDWTSTAPKASARLRAKLAWSLCASRGGSLTVTT